LFVDQSESEDQEAEPIEDILNNVQKIFDEYYLDAIYYNLKLLFEFLKLEYYTYYKVYRKAEKYFEEVNEETAILLANYSLYTYPAQFLLTKLDRSIRVNAEGQLNEENRELFEDFEADVNDIPKYITYISYRALSSYYADKYDEASRWLNKLLNELSLKKYPQAHLEIKLLLTLQYCLMKDYDLFNQSINSIQRQIRLMGDDISEHVILFTKILKTAANDTKKNKEVKLKSLTSKLKSINSMHFSPIMHVKLDEKFIERLS
jgi:tetratricopeptide (TPR) repeat protein